MSETQVDPLAINIRVSRVGLPVRKPGEQMPTIGARDFDTLLNQGLRWRNRAPLIWLLVVSCSVALATLGFISPLLLAVPILAFATGLIWIRKIRRADALGQVTTLEVRRGAEAQVRSNLFDSGLEQLSKAGRTWCTMMRDGESEFLFYRVPCRIHRAMPPSIKLDAAPWCIDVLGTMSIYFVFPAYIVLTHPGEQDREYSSGILSGVGNLTSSQVLDSEPLPGDAQLLGHRWRHERVDGGPDLRFSDNPRWPVILENRVLLMTPSDKNLILHVSNVLLASNAATCIGQALGAPVYRSGEGDEYKQATTEREEPAEPQPKSRRRASSVARDASPTSPFAVLGLEPGASEEEVATAYRDKARQYHPDKVATLGPELRALAETKMKEINAAYHAITKHG